MAFLKVILLVLGALCLAMGLLWIGQGTGIIMWPAQSFMLAQSKWALNGALLAGFGIGLIWLGRRKRG